MSCHVWRMSQHCTARLASQGSFGGRRCLDGGRRLQGWLMVKDCQSDSSSCPSRTCYTMNSPGRTRAGMIKDLHGIQQSDDYNVENTQSRLLFQISREISWHPWITSCAVRTVPTPRCGASSGDVAVAAGNNFAVPNSSKGGETTRSTLERRKRPRSLVKRTDGTISDGSVYVQPL